MKKRVLVVNDSKFEGIIMLDSLTKLGYDVKLTDEYSALDLIKTYDPHIAIVNYIMKDTTGDKFIMKIKKIKPSTDCFLSSCNQLTANAIVTDVDGIIQTPVTLKELIKVIEAIEKTLKCSNCNSEVDKAFNHCPYCGSKISLTS
ncbi:response regulator [Alkaliphilus serpentinus]|uniref:Stage 0 sporulation protein A homolog n=1 Tax=Alkaliphilus serpentinus TaxID=1482731 RepID=A0A833M8Q1_9FIRM|nr:response regulator [Alkaliphilus serpentinus]KAB3525449.1 response regulator [Alkaliphilus serpentinus]